MKKRSSRGVFSFKFLGYNLVMQPKKSFIHTLFSYLNKKENEFRAYLQKRPILYTLIGGVAVVLFWRGVWHTAEMIPFLTGPVSRIISSIVLLITGLFVFSFFVGDVFILSGIKKETKAVEKAEGEIKKETLEIGEIKNTLKKIEEEVDHLHKEHTNNHSS